MLASSLSLDRSVGVAENAERHSSVKTTPSTGQRRAELTVVRQTPCRHRRSSPHYVVLAVDRNRLDGVVAPQPSIAVVARRAAAAADALMFAATHACCPPRQAFRRRRVLNPFAVVRGVDSGRYRIRETSFRYVLAQCGI